MIPQNVIVKGWNTIFFAHVDLDHEDFGEWERFGGSASFSSLPIDFDRFCESIILPSLFEEFRMFEIVKCVYYTSVFFSP